MLPYPVLSPYPFLSLPPSFHSSHSILQGSWGISLLPTHLQRDFSIAQANSQGTRLKSDDLTAKQSSDAICKDVTTRPGHASIKVLLCQHYR